MNPAEILARAAERAAHRPAPESFYKITAATALTGRTTARLQIFGVIGDWWDGLDSATLASAIQDIEADEIDVHLNSPGGIAWDGIAIFNALRQHPARVLVSVDGLAASAASIVAMAGDEVVMSLGSQMMIHNASGVCFGQAVDMRQVADILDKINESMASVYAARAGGSAGDWRTVMDAETWYTAEEAVQAGLADGVDKAPVPAEDAKAAFDLTVFAYAGRQNAPAPTFPVSARAPQPPAEPVDHHPSTQGDGNMPNIPTGGLSERLGVPAEASEETFLAALDEALAERAEPTTTTELPAGVVAIDQTSLSQLQADAAQGRAAREHQLADERERVVQAALADGRITAASAQDWRESLAANPEASTKLLASLAKNAVPVTPQGYTGGVEESNDDDRIYAAAWGASTGTEA